MKKEKKKDARSKASKIADKAAKKARKKDKKSDLEKVYDLVKKERKVVGIGADFEKLYEEPLPGYHEFKNTVKPTKRTGKKKETCSRCIHYYKGRFCQKNGPSLHLAVMNRLLNCGLTEKEASDRSYFLPEVPASWNCKNWRDN